MAQQIKGIASIQLWNQCGGRRQLDPADCHPAFMRVLWHTSLPHKETNIIKIILSRLVCLRNGVGRLNKEVDSHLFLTF